MTDPDQRITLLLQAEDPSSSEQLLPLVYDQLRRMARARMAHEKPGQTLQPTALVHEAFLRVAGGNSPNTWDNRRHFFCAAAEAMRRILIDQARRKARLRHGGGVELVELEEADLCIDEPSSDLVAIDDALAELEALDPRARELVNLRFFVGLSTAETAEALGSSVSTIEREWRFLRTFLQSALGEGKSSDSGGTPSGNPGGSE